MRIRFITDLPWVITRARPGSFVLIWRSLRIRQGKCRVPRGILAPIKSFATRVCEGQGSDDPFSPGRCRPAGTHRLPLVLLWPWPGVIGAHAAHTRPTRWRRLAALAGRDQVPGQTSRTALAADPGVPVPGCDR